MALRQLALAALALMWLASASRAAEPAFSEHQVEAAFLYNFAKFIEWPDQAGGDDQPIVVGVVGEDPFGQVLDDAFAGKSIGGRSLRIARFSRATSVGRCDILFVADSEAAHIPEILDRVRVAPTLTVGESAGFAESGGMIGFVIADRRVRFDIDFRAMRSAGLKPSSQLLKVARRVLGPPGEDDR